MEATAAGTTTPAAENAPDSFVTRHYFNLGCFHWNPQSLRANIGDGNFQTDPNTTNSSAYNPFSLRIQQYTLPRTCWQSVWYIISKKKGDSLLGNQKTRTFYCMNNEINYAVVHRHILSFIT
jgi:hypothetical protein